MGIESRNEGTRKMAVQSGSRIVFRAEGGAGRSVLVPLGGVSILLLLLIWQSSSGAMLAVKISLFLGIPFSIYRADRAYRRYLLVDDEGIAEQLSGKVKWRINWADVDCASYSRTANSVTSQWESAVLTLHPKKGASIVIYCNYWVLAERATQFRSQLMVRPPFFSLRQRNKSRHPLVMVLTACGVDVQEES